MSFRFPGQYPDEKIILATRRHWIILLLRCLPVAILLALGIGTYWLLSRYALQFLAPPYLKAISLFFVAYAMFVWVFFYVVWVDYYLDIWLVTSYRIIDVQQKGLFYRVVAEQNLERVQDVTTKVHGILPMLLNYGEVSVQTAGAAERFFFQQVPKPNKIKKVIIDLARESAEKVEIVDQPPPARANYGGTTGTPPPGAKGPNQTPAGPPAPPPSDSLT